MCEGTWSNRHSQLELFRHSIQVVEVDLERSAQTQLRLCDHLFHQEVAFASIAFLGQSWATPASLRSLRKHQGFSGQLARPLSLDFLLQSFQIDQIDRHWMVLQSLAGPWSHPPFYVLFGLLPHPPFGILFGLLPHPPYPFFLLGVIHNNSSILPGHYPILLTKTSQTMKNCMIIPFSQRLHFFRGSIARWPSFWVLKFLSQP